MKDEQRTLTKIAAKKALDAIALVESSLSYIKPYDPEKFYTPKEREPYDALNDRFSRAVEVTTKFFRSYEMFMYGENSETLRDLLNRMEKLGFLGPVLTWMEMRDVRNKIVHEYIPEAIKEIYDSIMGPFAKQLRKVKKKIKTLSFEPVDGESEQ
ncbi:MAG: hypothetical protein GTO45_34125 [Candidatus Aminicenantes bacterium]|nr:hypothetical protein [Candidatus Aminicenantes bacterium]NIM83746.1 hypothetical protein [Candidatus Aminicenantes bacterium]NIN23206.1 hypothetical protein [Candidatus Aminicenantes bacterium]NIN46900.1 hypothetical protein [Candidatus Aminicenantes bacterium]NIN89822.1 hypothetical protein [Candidatus Aminicenantes bacterium]